MSLTPLIARKSSRIVSVRGFNSSRTSLLAVIASPILSPCPLTPLGERTEHGVELERVDLFDQLHHVLKHGVDLGGDVLRSQHCSRGQPLRAGIGRVDKIDELRTEQGDGLDARLDVGWDVLDLRRSMSSWMRVKSPPLIELTWPTCTPRILTRELGSSTRPDRSAVNVTGTVGGVNVPLNMLRLSTTATTMPTTRNTAHHSEEIRRAPVPCVTASPREVEVAGLAVEGQGDQENHHLRRDQRCPGGTSDRLAHARGSARGVEAVIRVDQHDHQNFGDRDAEREEHGLRIEKGVEVVVEYSGALPVKTRW